MNPNDETATGNHEINNAHFDPPMQDITTRLESHLYGNDEQNELDEKDEAEVLDDADVLPDGDDSDSDDDEGSTKDMAESDQIEDGDDSLASFLGIDDDRLSIDEDGSVKLSAIIDGKSLDVDLKDLVTSYQLQGHVNNKSISLENERKSFVEEKTNFSNDMSKRVEGLETLSKILEQELVGNYNDVPWDKLRTEDPAEWNALQADYASKAQKIQQMQTLIGEEGKRIFEEQSAENIKKHNSYLETEMEKMIETNPSWSDESVRIKEQSEIKDFLSSTYNFDENDMSQVTDHRLVKLIQDAKKFHSGSKAIEEKKNKVVPKFRKPGAAKANAEQLRKARSIKANKKAIKDSGGHPKAIAASIIDRM